MRWRPHALYADSGNSTAGSSVEFAWRDDFEQEGCRCGLGSIHRTSTVGPSPIEPRFVMVPTVCDGRRAGAVRRISSPLSWGVTHAVLVREFVEPRFQIILEQELSRFQARRKLVGVARPNNGCGNRLVRQHPGDGQCHEAYAGLSCNGEELIDSVELPVMPITALIHLTRVAEGKAAAFGRRISPSVLPREEATGDGVVGDDSDSIITAEREHLTLYLAEQQVVARLNRVEPGEPERFAAPDGTDQLVGQKIRTSDVADLSLMDEIIERTERFVDRGRWIEPMQLIEVDVVGLQAAQGCVDCVENVLSGVAAVERCGPGASKAFRREDEAIPPSMKPATEDLLRAADSREIASERIDVRTVDEVDSPFRSSIEN
jgi:hypothetical protein